jgi:Tfp pilus assembly protein FimT
MVAVAIIAVVGGLAFTSYRLFVKGARLGEALYLLSQDLQSVRERAIATGIDHRVFFDIADKRYVAFRGDTIVLERRLPKGVDFSVLDGVNVGACNVGGVPTSPVTFPQDTLTFYSTGEATEGAIYLSDGRSQVALYVNPLGRIGVCLWEEGSWHED